MTTDDIIYNLNNGRAFAGRDGLSAGYDRNENTGTRFYRVSSLGNVIGVQWTPRQRSEQQRWISKDGDYPDVPQEHLDLLRSAWLETESVQNVG